MDKTTQPSPACFRILSLLSLLPLLVITPTGVAHAQAAAPADAAAPAPPPPPYSLPWQLRPVAAANVVRSDTAVAFYGLQPGELHIVEPRKGPRHWPDSAVLLHASAGNLVNPPTWTGGPALGRDRLVQSVLRPSRDEQTSVRSWREIYAQRASARTP